MQAAEAYLSAIDEGRSSCPFTSPETQGDDAGHRAAEAYLDATEGIGQVRLEDDSFAGQASLSAIAPGGDDRLTIQATAVDNGDEWLVVTSVLDED